MTLVETTARMSAGEIVQLKRKLAQYLERQKDAERRASRTTNPEDRQALQQIAETWRSLAQQTGCLIADLQH